jgi:cytochrome c oxidase subunit 1
MWTPPEERVIVTGLRNDRREALVTTATDADPHHRIVLPGDSIWPFLTALGSGIGLAGSIFYFRYYYVALLFAAIGLTGWFWPRLPKEIEP